MHSTWSLPVFGYGTGDNSDLDFMVVVVVLGVLVTLGVLVYRLVRKRSPEEFVCPKCGSLNISVVRGTATCVDCGHVSDIADHNIDGIR